VNAFVLAGGQSTRMGRDKAMLELDGRPLVEQTLNKLRSLDLNPRIGGSRPDLARFAAIVADNCAHAGPLAGIEAALAASDSDLNLFVPVDLPGIPAAFLRWLIRRAETSHALATIPRYGNRPQPLCAIYSQRLLPGLRLALGAGNLKIMDAIRQSASALGEFIDAFDVESVAAASPAEWPSDSRPADWFRNVNTPADYWAVQAPSGAKSRHPIS
jgi:molybdenum cofactor guanylyltransferase